MKKIILCLAILTSTTFAFAESPIMPPSEKVENALEVANLINQRNVRNCIGKIEEKGFDTIIDNVLKDQYQDVNNYTVEGMLVGGDIIYGNWAVSVEQSFLNPGFGQPTYKCTILFVNEL